MLLRSVSRNWRVEKAHQIHLDEKREQKFIRLNIDLLQSRSWMEKASFAFNSKRISNQRPYEFGSSSKEYFLCKLFIYDHAYCSKSL